MAETIEREGGREKEVGFGSAKLPLAQNRGFLVCFFSILATYESNYGIVTLKGVVNLDVSTAFPISLCGRLRHCIFNCLLTDLFFVCLFVCFCFVLTKPNSGRARTKA